MIKIYKKNVFILSFIFIFLSLSFNAAHAYVLTGKKWQSGETSFRVNSAGAPAYGLAAVLNGMNMWTDVNTSSFQFNYAGATASATVGYNGQNIVCFNDLGGSTIGYCTWWYSGSSLLESDIQLRRNWSWTQSSLTSVACHEFGHALGLSHSQNSSAIMYYMYHGQTSLHQDDIDGITYVYPGQKILKGLGNIDGDVGGKADVLWQINGTGEINVWLMDGITPVDQLNTSTIHSGVSSVWQIKGFADFSGDGCSDILWQHSGTGQLYIWLLNGTDTYDQLQSGTIHSGLSSIWRLRAVADFNGDGRSDLLWQHGTSGQLYVWLMNGTTPYASLQSGVIHSGLSLSWILRGVGDFNGDGKSDLLWQHSGSGQIYVWLMNGTTPYASLQSGKIHNGLSSVWRLSGVSDFNGDGRDDLLWKHNVSGQIYVWLMNGTTPYASLSSGMIHSGLPSSWVIKGVGDFNGDGRSDLFWQNSSSGNVYIWLMNGITPYASLASGSIHSGLSSEWSLKGLGDFDGDGCDDALWQSTRTGQVYVWLLDGTTPYSVLASSAEAGALNSVADESSIVQGN